MSAREPEPLALAPEGRPLPPEAREQAEWECDLLVALMGRRADAAAPGPEAAPPPPDEADERFAEWRARWLRACEADEARRALGRAAGRAAAAWRLAERVRGSVAAARLGVRLAPNGAPEVEEASAVIAGAPLARAVEAAAARRCAARVGLAVAAGAGRDLWDEPCESVVRLPADLPAGRYVTIPVAGDSMEPLLHAGDTVLVKLGSTIESDSVVVARHPEDGYVVKRVGRIGRTWVELTSLNPAYAPLRIPRRPELVVGTVVMRWCGHGGGTRHSALG
ncbi:MAG TPA: S24 family peptidase [Gemmatimonadaceae bacterium]|nr:S24 family peptidase [Gemmatimonadaceae bacterium]